MSSPDNIAKLIGARIKTARKMAGFKTQADLNAVLVSKYTWSDSRLGNFESGHSRPSIEVVEIIAKETGTSACWIMFGTGPIRSHERDVQAVRYQNLKYCVESISKSKLEFEKFLTKTETNNDALNKCLANPFKKIGTRQARRFEKALGKTSGWFDEQHIEHDPICNMFPDELRELMTIHSELSPDEKVKLIRVAKVLWGED